MELFLNLCWLSLLLPAFLLWRQRTAVASSDRPATRPIVIVCVLGCALILLFPVISATDDLHAMRPEMEESERSFRDANRCAGTSHALAHATQSVLVRSASLTPGFEQIGIVLPSTPDTLKAFSAPARASRAPPLDHPASL